MTWPQRMPVARVRLERWLQQRLGHPEIRIDRMHRLAGGAIHENWLIVLQPDPGLPPGLSEIVVRAEAGCNVIAAHDPASEFQLHTMAWDSGIRVPEPLFCDPAGAAIGRPALFMRRVGGTADPLRIVRDAGSQDRRASLVAAIGRELARIHRLQPTPEQSALLGKLPGETAGRRIGMLSRQVEAMPDPWPAVEWAFRWLFRHQPRNADPVVCHGDYRTGNIMLDGDRITGVLDWEFASWGDRLEDIGWFCARCWRFGQDRLEAGGIGHRADLYQGYEEELGRPVDWSMVGYWEILATVRWAIIARQQGQRARLTGYNALELAPHRSQGCGNGT